jgi:hypothetical protein
MRASFIRALFVAATAIAAVTSLPAPGRSASPTQSGPSSSNEDKNVEPDVAKKEAPATGRSPGLRPQVIEILKARYGGLQDRSDCDVTASVKQLCEKRTSCSVPVADDLCLAPTTGLPRLIPALSVTYRCWSGENPRSRSAEKPFTLRLVCEVGRH